MRIDTELRDTGRGDQEGDRGSLAPAGRVADASSAAPGVDHAIVTGIRSRRLNSTLPAPMVKQSASSPDAACAGLAPTAPRPANTTAKELVNPATVVIDPGQKRRSHAGKGRAVDAGTHRGRV